jgi:MFS superfamily sulfate permease-like transporter
MRSIRNILLCALVFLAWIYFVSILSGVVIAILLYLVLIYRDRVKELEKKSSGPSQAGPGEVPSSSEP